MSNPSSASRETNTLALDGSRPPRHDRLMGELLRFIRTSWIGSLSAIFLVALVLIAVFANQVAPYDPMETNYAAIRSPPSSDNLLGTDSLGRDVLSRIIHGARITLIVAVFAVLIGDSIGFLWGLVTGFFGDKVDLGSQRVLDVLMAFPSLILALLLMVALGAGLRTVIIAIAVTRIPVSTRVVRSMVLSVKELAYVEAARSVGASTWRLMLRHVAPQCVAPFLVVATAHLGAAIFVEAALSFLGVGVPPPTPSWGNMLGGVLAQVFRPPMWLVLFPGIAITLTILAINLLGDAVRDYMDPRLRGRDA